MPAMLVRLECEAPSGAALLAANARLHWGSASGAREPAHRRAPVITAHHRGQTHAICLQTRQEMRVCQACWRSSFVCRQLDPTARVMRNAQRAGTAAPAAGCVRAEACVSSVPQDLGF